MKDLERTDVISLLSEYVHTDEERFYLDFTSDRYAETFNMIRPALEQYSDNLSMVEIGTGSGSMSILVKKLFPNANITATDITIDSATEVKLQGLGIKTVQGSVFEKGMSLPFANGTFDLCMMFEVFEHIIDDPRHVFSEMGRILKRGGKLLMTTPNLAFLYNRFILLRGHQPQIFLTSYHGRPSPRGHFREWTASELVNIASDTGFKVLNQEYLYGFGSHGMVQKKPLLRIAYYPAKFLLKVRPSFREIVALYCERT